MRQLLSGIGFIVVAMLCAYPAFAQKDIYSADYLLPGCRDFIGTGTSNAHLRGYCVDLVVGVARDAYAPGICRKKGSKNKRTLLLEERTRALLDNAKEIIGSEPFDGDAHRSWMGQALPVRRDGPAPNFR